LDGKTLGFSQNDRLSTDFRKPLKRPSEVLFWYHFCTKIFTVENRWGQGKTLKTTVDEIRQARRIPWVPLTAFPVLTSPSLPNLPVCFVCPTAVGGGGWCGLDWGFRVLPGSPDPARGVSCRQFLRIGKRWETILLPQTAAGAGAARRGCGRVGVGVRPGGIRKLGAFDRPNRTKPAQEKTQDKQVRVQGTFRRLTAKPQTGPKAGDSVLHDRAAVGVWVPFQESSLLANLGSAAFFD
jgi:hypothetical protein